MPFEILPIPENLRREELIVQLADRLRKLEVFNETLFGRVEQKLTTIQSTIRDIDQRAEVCRQKVQFIQQDNKKATVLYSHPKFPVEDSSVREYFDSLFEDQEYSFDDQLKCRLFNKDLDPSNWSPKKINSTHVPFDDDANVKSHFVIYDKAFPEKIIPEELSEEYVPWNHITSLSSLLLFNTSLNAYNISNRHQALEQKQKSKKKIDEPNDNVDNAATFTGPTPAVENEDLRIKLSFNSAPELLGDLPDALPSLSGLADEFQFQDEDDSLYSLENSSTNFKNLPDLAHISSKSSKVAPFSSFKKGKALQNLFDEEPLPVSSVPSFTTAPVPPPPPPPPSLPTLPSLTPETVISAPPPPPPPIPSTSALDSSSKPSTSSAPTGTSNRASLLESIRQAGGRPKKTTIKEKKQEEKLKKKEDEINSSAVSLKKDGEPMDMLSELKNRLNSRRAGISAEPKKVIAETSRPSPSSGFGVIDTMKNLIPEPVADSDSSSGNNSENEDWMD